MIQLQNVWDIAGCVGIAGPGPFVAVLDTILPYVNGR